MCDTINQRLNKFCEAEKISPPDIYLGTKISRQLWYDYTKTTKSIPLDKLEVLIKKLVKLNARWLITGEGDMYNENKDIIEDPTSPYTTECKNPICKMKIDHLHDKIRLLEENLQDLRQRGGCPPGEIEGGVEAPGRTG